MSFATLGCVVPPEGGVEECDAGTDAPGVVGVVVEVDAEAFRVGEDGQRSLWTHASELRSGTKSQNEFSVGGQEKGLTDAPCERIK